MVLKLLIISTLFHITLGGQRYECSTKSALHLLKRPTYDFSIRILDRVAQSNDAHFVYSPISTWLQLTALADGAEGRTFGEIWNVTRHLRKHCFKMNLRRLIRIQNKGLRNEYRRKSLIVIDKNKGVRDTYKKDVLRYYAVKVLTKNFDSPETAANEVNDVISKSTNGVIQDSVYQDDFNNTFMLLSDNVYFNNAWRFPFDVAFTRKEPFRSRVGNYLGDVNMMSYVGHLNVAVIRHINAKVLEIPCVGDFSMLVFLPIRRNWIVDTFYNMRKTTIMSIFNRFKWEGERLVHVKLPRFRLNATVDNLPELLFDMGVRNVFDPRLSELQRISESDDLYVSLMTQVADIEVTERGVRASASPLSQINETAEKIEFFADKPFAFMIVERKTQFILFAGTYSVPSVY